MSAAAPTRTVLEELWIRTVILAYAIPTRVLDLCLLVWRPRLLLAYVRLWRAALRRSPYRWPTSFEARYALRRATLSASEVVYGETPLFSAVRLFRRAGVRAGDLVVDPLAGRGRVLLAARWLGARATGVEVLDENVRAARAILQAVGATLESGDGARAAYRDADCVYLCWPNLARGTRARFVDALTALRPGARVIALGRAIDAPELAPIDRLLVMTVWGPETAFVYERVG